MEANELRIGNLVVSKNETCTVIQIGNDYIKMYARTITDIVMNNPSRLLPIGLTTDFFKLFSDGEDNITEGFGLDSHFSICLEEDVIYLYGLEGSIRLEHIKYVHQLQNLYFALTGEELIKK